MRLVEIYKNRNLYRSYYHLRFRKFYLEHSRFIAILLVFGTIGLCFGVYSLLAKYTPTVSSVMPTSYIVDKSVLTSDVANDCTDLSVELSNNKSLTFGFNCNGSKSFK